MKIMKGRKEKTQNHETVDAVTHTHTHTHTQYNLKDEEVRENIKKENLFSSFYTFANKTWKICKANFTGKNVTLNDGTRNNQIKNRRTYILMPLIVMLVLICVIAICVVGAHRVRPTETAELDKNVEQGEEIKAAAVQANKDITIEETGIYLIKLHGGSGTIRVANAGKDNEEEWYGNPGSLTIGYVHLERGDVLTTKSHTGGNYASGSTRSSKGGNGISVYLNNNRLGYASGGPGASVVGYREYCSKCSSDEETTSYSNLDKSDYDTIGWRPEGAGTTVTAQRRSK